MEKNIYRIGILTLISLIIFNIGYIDDIKANVETKKEGTKEVVISIGFEEWYKNPNQYSINNLEESKIPREVRGLYVTGSTAGTPKYDHLIELLNSTELNSLVIDVKEDSGYITYKSDVPKVKEINSDKKTYMSDVDDVLRKAKENNIYTIARIVTFKDPYFAGTNTETAMRAKSGGVWRDRSGVMWVDPYQKEVWDYNIEIAKEAAEKGFNEIQFDYVRFPDNGKKVDAEVNFNNPDNLTKAETIAAFLSYAKEQLKDYPVFISADVFGLTTTVVDDMGIGQQWELISPTVDYISPMMYPSHYGPGLYGIPVPDTNPYKVIFSGIEDAKEKDSKLSKEGNSVAIIRPWYQDFTATWVNGYINYGSKEVIDQINAGNELGVTQYIMWNPGNNYSEGAWVKK